MKPDIN